MRSIYCTMNPDLGCKRMHIVEGRNLPWGPEFDLNDENGEQWSFSE